MLLETPAYPDDGRGLSALWTAPLGCERSAGGEEVGAAARPPKRRREAPTAEAGAAGTGPAVPSEEEAAGHAELVLARVRGFPPDGLAVASVAAGEGHAAAVTADGRAWTWGDNSNGCGRFPPLDRNETRLAQRGAPAERPTPPGRTGRTRRPRRQLGRSQASHPADGPSPGPVDLAAAAGGGAAAAAESVACGARHSLVLLRGGAGVVAFGWNLHGWVPALPGLPHTQPFARRRSLHERTHSIPPAGRQCGRAPSAAPCPPALVRTLSPDTVPGLRVTCVAAGAGHSATVRSSEEMK